MCLCAPVVFPGCRSATVSDPVTVTFGGNDAESRMEFWHTLGERAAPSNDDAFHAVLLFFDDTDPAGDYAHRVAALKDRGWLPGDFDEPANAAVTRGTLAVILASALEIKGGITMRLFGPTPRYATRQLIADGLYPPSSPQQIFSGAQFVALIGRVEDYRAIQGLERIDTADNQ